MDNSATNYSLPASMPLGSDHHTDSEPGNLVSGMLAVVTQTEAKRRSHAGACLTWLLLDPKTTTVRQSLGLSVA